jgi:hypothetical protein
MQFFHLGWVRLVSTKGWRGPCFLDERPPLNFDPVRPMHITHNVTFQSVVVTEEEAREFDCDIQDVGVETLDLTAAGDNDENTAPPRPTGSQPPPFAMASTSAGTGAANTTRYSL